MTLEDFNALVAKVYKQAHVSIAVQGNFDSRKMYNLVEIEQMLGNKSHVEDLEEYNPIRMESSDITFTIDLDTLMGALGGGETEAQVAPKNHKKAPAAKRPADIIIDAPSTDDGLEK